LLDEKRGKNKSRYAWSGKADTQHKASKKDFQPR
jgi:hypothetical protein